MTIDRQALGPATLTASHLAKTFPTGKTSVAALADVSLELQPGEFIAIIGPSGCGKSTLLHVLAGLIGPDAGEVRLDGAAGAPRLGRLAYMPQTDALFPWRTVLDNCLLPAEIRHRDLRAARREAGDLLDEFGLAGFAGHLPSTLSGGMRQRVAFLRTWLSGQQILLLDEPFGALDALTRATLQEWLLAVWERHRRSVVLVTHDIDEAIFLADRVYVLTERPARVATVAPVNLPRPRDRARLLDPECLRLKGQLWNALGVAGGAIGGARR